jgi:lysostaphin
VTDVQCFPLPAGSYSWGSPFGPRGGGFHPGQDLPVPTGTPLYAPADGLLSSSWDPTGGGNWSSVVTAAGDYFGLGHQSGFRYPGAYQRPVAAGELIGWTGSTGASTGPHLHFAWRPAGAS